MIPTSLKADIVVAEPGPFKANLEKCRPIGVVTFLVDAPLTAKDISLPITLCLERARLSHHNVSLKRDVGITTKVCKNAGGIAPSYN